MKKLFLFALFAMMICSCSDNGTEDNPNPNPDPDPTPSAVLTDILLTADKLSFGINGGTQSVTINFSYDNDYLSKPNDQWKLTGGEAWCTPSITSGNDADVIDFAIEEYTGNKERTATYVISCGNIKTELQIIQNGITLIHVENAGTLDTVLSEFDKKTLTALKITGNINDEDIFIIRDLANPKAEYPLTYLDLSEISLTSLPSSAFAETSILYALLPNSLTAIPESLFYSTPIESVIISSSVESIGRMAFCWCNLKKIDLPNSLRMIGERAFANNSGLTTITIPSSMETIDDYAFSNCFNVHTITFEKPSKLKAINSYTFELRQIYDKEGASYLESIEIPASVEKIDGWAFKSCKKLHTITFEENSMLKNIQGYAFDECASLSTFDASNCSKLEGIGGSGGTQIALFKIGTTTPPRFNGDFGLATYSILKVPKGCIDAYKAKTGWTTFSSISELDE